jgi:hypothetical protein
MINFDLPGVFRLMKGLGTLEDNLSIRRLLRDLDLTLRGALTKFIDGGSFTAEFPQFKWLETIEVPKEVRRFIEAYRPGLTEADIEHIQKWLNHAVVQGNSLEMQAVLDRTASLQGRLTEPISTLSISDLYTEVRLLPEAVENGLTTNALYRYPQGKANLLRTYEADWSGAVSALPSIGDDVASAVDCYAFGRNTASVFHSMRIVEHGLRAFAASVNIVWEVGQWNIVIEQIEAEVRDIGNRWPAGTSKERWIRFYSEAAKEFFYFKAGWRNYVSHGGDPYDQDQALSVLEHVRAFMNHLATRFGETAA